MSETVLRELGLADGLLRHLQAPDPSSPLFYRVQPARHWRSSPIAGRDIVPLWECGTVLTYFDRPSATFRQCSLEDVDVDWFRYRSLQAVLARLFIELYEDEVPDDVLVSLAGLVGFRHGDRLVAEADSLSRESYPDWAETFPSRCES